MILLIDFPAGRVRHLFECHLHWTGIYLLDQLSSRPRTWYSLSECHVSRNEGKDYSVAAGIDKTIIAALP